VVRIRGISRVRSWRSGCRSRERERERERENQGELRAGELRGLFFPRADRRAMIRIFPRMLRMLIFRRVRFNRSRAQSTATAGCWRLINCASEHERAVSLSPSLALSLSFALAAMRSITAIIAAPRDPRPLPLRLLLMTERGRYRAFHRTAAIRARIGLLAMIAARRGVAALSATSSGRARD